ncbi:cupin domain-containing protein [Novosphingobium sp. FKTRR1]|uniref:cupin domain-containing protein n=1 Tax=Novosphingobium sp. FKTRR1 TaxID=2879118 RepID=UPI001CEFE002|nr:cupin domain-containing protein [Novosphingobium sp. FKTRR1]
MRLLTLTLAAALMLPGIGHAAEAEAGHPAKLPAAAMPLAIFKSKAAVNIGKDGTVIDAPLRKSADGKFMSGVYTVKKKHREDFREKGYPEDEFMLFVKGGITLTSADGHVTKVGQGDAISLDKGWKGVWESDGYTKYYVIYSQDGVE